MNENENQVTPITINTIQLKRGQESVLTSNDTVLKSGEICLVLDSSNKFKSFIVGDGNSTISTLLYKQPLNLPLNIQLPQTNTNDIHIEKSDGNPGYITMNSVSSSSDTKAIINLYNYEGKCLEIKETETNGSIIESDNNLTIKAISDSNSEVKIQNLTNPINDTDAANKGYVDARDGITLETLKVLCPGPLNINQISALAGLGTLQYIMDYGEQVAIEWTDDGTDYNPALNFAAVENAELDGGDIISTAIFEWDKVLPFDTDFDAPEAICYFDGTEGAGTYYIGISEAYNGWNTSKHIQFTLNVAPAADDQLVLSLNQNINTDPTSGVTWNLYAKNSTISKDSGTTSDGMSGTLLGNVKIHSPSGKVNAIRRIVTGYGRWSQSAVRQYLNSTAGAGAWWTAQNEFDRPPTYAATKAGFLAGYDASTISHFMECKNVTVACNADNNAQDVTYDRVFLASLEQCYISPQFSGKEGAYWQYYKDLLGTSSPVSRLSTYAVLKKQELASSTYRTRWLRSGDRTTASYPWVIESTGKISSLIASYPPPRLAPCVRIGG